MKKFFGFIMVLACVLFVSAKAYEFSNGVSVLKPGVRIVSTSPDVRLIAFMDLDSKKIGFVRNGSALSVALPPTFDRVDNQGFLLLPVEKGGKWGVVDLGCRYYIPGHKFYDPFVPCIYNKIEVLDDYCVKCDGKTIDIRKQGYEEY